MNDDQMVEQAKAIIIWIADAFRAVGIAAWELYQDLEPQYKLIVGGIILIWLWSVGASENRKRSSKSE